MKKLLLSIFTITLISSAKSQDLPNPPANLQVLPAGSYVIPMDNTLQGDVALGSSGKFNLASYGLIVHLLNYNVKIKWVIKAGKTKDGVDFTASAQMFLPSLEASVNTRNFIAGPFVIFAQDTLGVASLVNTFYTQMGLTGNARPKLFKTTAATPGVDIRYDLTGFKPKAAILTDGGNEDIHVDYMIASKVPVINYSLSDGASLQENCYTFASEPHNDEEGAEVDSAIVHIKQFVLSGRNFLAECKAVETYENNPLGRFQTTDGIDVVNKGISTNITYPHPDLSYYQFQGVLNGNAGGSVKNWEPLGGQSTTAFSKAHGNGSNSNAQAASLVKLTSSGLGGMVYYLGNHEFGSNNQSEINGIRMYMNAFLTPVAPNSFCETIPTQPLDINLVNFQGYLNTNKVTLNWSVLNNDHVQQFELERSTDGNNFQVAAMIFNTDKTGTENYQFGQPMNGDKVYYRLKLTDKSFVVTYSKVLVFKNTIGRDFDLKVLNNPVTDKLTISFQSNTTGTLNLRLLDMNGREVMVQKITSYKGINTMSLPLPALKSGMYIVDLFDGNNHNTAKFIK